MSEIEDALKRINEGLLKVYLRGGKIVKIPAQEINCPLRNGVREVKKIEEDITEKEK